MIQQGDIRSFRGMSVQGALRALDDEGPSLKEMLSYEAEITRDDALQQLWEEIEGWSTDELEIEAQRLETNPYAEYVRPGLQRGDRLEAIHYALAIRDLL